MSTLIIDELYPGIVFPQPFKISKDIQVAHIRPWVILWGTLADGDLVCRVKDGTTLLQTVTLNYTDINLAKTLDYAHGFLRIDFDTLVLRVPQGSTEKEYIIEYEMINHTKDTSNFLGIVRRWEDKTYPTYGDGVVGGEAPNDSVEPSGLELFEYKEI
jgi:hypothetical protein